MDQILNEKKGNVKDDTDQLLNDKKETVEEDGVVDQLFSDKEEKVENHGDMDDKKETAEKDGDVDQLSNDKEENEEDQGDMEEARGEKTVKVKNHVAGDEEASLLLKELEAYALSKGVEKKPMKNYIRYTNKKSNAEGHYKMVRYLSNDNGKVVQTLRHHMTHSQRIREVVCLLKLKGQDQFGNLLQTLTADDKSLTNNLIKNDISGFLMERYSLTLKEYTHIHTHPSPLLTPYQKLDLVHQILSSLKSLHEQDIAHRDISEVNFMINDKLDLPPLADGSQRVRLTLIDFGRALFLNPDDVKKWWIGVMATDQTRASKGDEYIPESKEELETWCKELPLISTKPDLSYWCNRSIQTLPRGGHDRSILPWLIDPKAEDMYSAGVVIWKVFTNTEPWHGLLYDHDLTRLREMVKNDAKIEMHIEEDVVGEYSLELLYLSIRAEPNDRFSASDILSWLEDPDNADELIKEWTAQYGKSASRGNRRRQSAKKSSSAAKKPKTTTLTAPQDDSIQQPTVSSPPPPNRPLPAHMQLNPQPEPPSIPQAKVPVPKSKSPTPPTNYWSDNDSSVLISPSPSPSSPSSSLTFTSHSSLPSPSDNKYAVMILHPQSYVRAQSRTSVLPPAPAPSQLLPWMYDRSFNLVLPSRGLVFDPSPSRSRHTALLKEPTKQQQPTASSQAKKRWVTTSTNWDMKSKTTMKGSRLGGNRFSDNGKKWDDDYGSTKRRRIEDDDDDKSELTSSSDEENEDNTENEDDDEDFSDYQDPDAELEARQHLPSPMSLQSILQ